jgi:lysophospholipase L1-like esterase
MKKLVLFGDSLVAYCHKTEVLLLEQYLNDEYDVYNCAVGGWNSDDLVKKGAYIAGLQADVVIISVGTNDGSPWKSVGLDNFKANLAPIADAFNKSRIIFFPPPPINEEKMTAPKRIMNEELQQYNQAVLEFCKEHEFELWDSWKDVMPLINTDNDPHEEDGVHFSDDGYRYVLNKLAEVVKA